jgi:hypothetical protein
MAVQRRLLAPQCQDFARHRSVVVGTGVLAARHPGTPSLFAQVATRREGEKRHDQRARQRDRVAARQPALDRRLMGCGAQEIGQPGQVGLVAQLQRKGGFVMQHVLREGGRQLGQALHHL